MQARLPAQTPHAKRRDRGGIGGQVLGEALRSRLSDLLTPNTDIPDTVRANEASLIGQIRNVSIGLRQLVNEFTEVAAPFRWSVSAD
jgi:hypothetical protein